MANLIALRRSPVSAQSEGVRLSENEFWGKKLLRAIDSQQLKIAEQTAFWGTVAAAAIATVSQQTMVAIPLSLCCGLNLINRRRFEEVLQQRLATTTAEADCYVDFEEIQDKVCKTQ